jgi:serine/threonine protein kinase
VVEDQLKSDEADLHFELVKIFSVPPDLKLLQLHVDSLMEVYERLFSTLSQSRESIPSPALAAISDYFVTTTVEWLADDGRVVLRRPFGEVTLEQLLPIGHQPREKPFNLMLEGRILEDFEVKWIALQIYSAMKQLHALDYYHGSLSPSNVVIDSATLDVKLVDIAPYKPFYLGHDDPGIALFFFDEEKKKYLAPERFSKDETKGKESVTSLQKSADLYALGVILRDLLGEDSIVSRHLTENRSFADAPDIFQDPSTLNFLMPYIKGSLNARKSSAEKLHRIRVDRDDLLVLFASNQEASLLLIRQLFAAIDEVYQMGDDENLTMCLELLKQFALANKRQAKSRVLMPSLSSFMMVAKYDTHLKLLVLDVISSCIDDVSVIKSFFGTMMSWLDHQHEPALRGKILECLCTMSKFLDETPTSLERHLELAVKEPSLGYLSRYLDTLQEAEIDILLEKLEGANTSQLLKGLHRVKAKMVSERTALKALFTVFPGVLVYPDEKIKDLSVDILSKACSFLSECDQVVNMCPLLKRVLRPDLNADYFLPGLFLSKMEKSGFYSLLMRPIDSELFKLVSRNRDQFERFLKELEGEDSARLGMLEKFLSRTENQSLEVLTRDVLKVKLSCDVKGMNDSFSPITNSVTSLEKSDYEATSIWSIDRCSAMFNRGLPLRFGKLSKAVVSPDAKHVAFYDANIGAITVWHSEDFVMHALSDPFLEIAVQVDDPKRFHLTLSNTRLIVLCNYHISVYSLKLSALINEGGFKLFDSGDEIVEIKLINSNDLVIVCTDKIFLWGLAEQRELWCPGRMPSYHGRVTSVCYFAEQDHLFLITGSSEGYLTLWDLRYGLRVRSWRLPLQWSCINVISSYSPAMEEESGSLMYPPSLWIASKADFEEDEHPLKDLLLVDLGKAQVTMMFSPSLAPDLLLLEDQPYTVDRPVSELKSHKILAITSIVGTEWLLAAGSDRKLYYYSTTAPQKKPKVLLSRSPINVPVSRLHLMPVSSKSMLVLLGSEEASVYSVLECHR